MMHHASSVHHPGATGPGLLARVAMFVALGALLRASWRSCCQTHQRRMAQRTATKERFEQVWEGEGGQSQMPEPRAAVD